MSLRFLKTGSHCCGWLEGRSPIKILAFLKNRLCWLLKRFRSHAQIDGEEFVYRALIDSAWSPRRNRPSTSAFKNNPGSNCHSLERSGGRAHEEVHEGFQRRWEGKGRGIMGMKADGYRQHKVQLVPNELKNVPGQLDNPYHCLLENANCGCEIDVDHSRIMVLDIVEFGWFQPPKKYEQ